MPLQIFMNKTEESLFACHLKMTKIRKLVVLQAVTYQPATNIGYLLLVWIGNTTFNLIQKVKGMLIHGLMMKQFVLRQEIKEVITLTILGVFQVNSRTQHKMQSTTMVMLLTYHVHVQLTISLHHQALYLLQIMDGVSAWICLSMRL